MCPRGEILGDQKNLACYAVIEYTSGTVVWDVDGIGQQNLCDMLYKLPAIRIHRHLLINILRMVN